MGRPKQELETDQSTEQKIKQAARKIFHEKGFSAARTRDIAEEAGINLALLNYYFRSKEKLFDLIMFETMQSFLQSIKETFHNTETTFDQKIDALVQQYLELLYEHPDIPIFIMSELRRNPKQIMSKLGLKEIIMQSVFLKQFKELIESGTIKEIHPMHFLMNLLGMIVFPFIASPMVQQLGDINNDQFKQLMTERQKLIPQWTRMILYSK